MDILKLFQYNQKLRFSDIEKALKIRSNKLAYHLKNLTNKGIIAKQGREYFLSESSEHIIPYLSEKNSVLSVILIHIGDNKKCFLYERKKRPFKDRLSLPGGRVLTGESISDCVKRIMKEKFGINARLKTIHSVSAEHLIKNNKILYSYILIFVSAKTTDSIKLESIEKNKDKIISSDYLLLEKDLNKKIDIKTINTRKI